MQHRATSLRVTLTLALALGAATARAEDTFELRTSDAKAALGVPAVTSLTIAGKNGWKVNQEAPISVKLTPEPGIAVAKPKLTAGDLAERNKERARFDIAFTASAPGRKTIAAETRFVMCQETACVPVTQKVALAVDVEAAAARGKKPKK